MATDRLRVEGNERLDLADFQFALGDQTLANHRQLQLMPILLYTG